MKLFKVPFRYWPLAQHFWLALAFLALLCAAGAGGIHLLEKHLQTQQAELDQLQSRLAEARKTPPPSAIEQFEKALPSPQVAEAVARDITAFAAEANVQLSSVQIEHQASKPSDYATVLYQISAKGEYKQTKQWIAELLGRYETLGIKSLSLQALANEAARQELRMTLVLYVRG
ncbi:type 4a pilus biogenesis protein PilO [uncultured Rhodoferax sp.]|uniref:type 4a pilus biogenesis protein PilO n=1 Tax=uncultured Rhodoferax sp. TaxID=223188 RepID=UPI0025D9C9DE|nr:type 4a pilus biogenesis protein PilO [uncultured Rhodoferax sp.]